MYDNGTITIIYINYITYINYFSSLLFMIAANFNIQFFLSYLWSTSEFWNPILLKVPYSTFIKYSPTYRNFSRWQNSTFTYYRFVTRYIDTAI